MHVPIYLITGFLESGKTSFIQQVIVEGNFVEDEKTLLIATEEGVEEYDTDIWNIVAGEYPSLKSVDEN